MAKWQPTDEIKAQLDKVLKDAGSLTPAVAAKAQGELATALQTPLREAVLSGDLIGGIFARETYAPGTAVEYPLDLIRPGTEGDFTAYTIPDHGAIPHRFVEGDRLMIPTYMLGNSIDCNLRFLRNANWNVIQRMVQILEAGFVKKMNDDGFSTIISAGVSRNILAYDGDAAAGQFTPRLVALMQTVMRRNGGGNSTSVNRGKLTDLYVSPEAIDDVRAWTLNIIPDAVRTNIYYANDGSGELLNVYGVKLHDIDELGVGQQYNLYYTSTLAKSLASSDTELVIGLDMSKGDSFVMPEVQGIQIFEDNTLHRQGTFGLYANSELGFAVLDSRRVLLGSL